MRQIKSYAAEVVKVNGTATGPFAPGPASSFYYDLDVATEDGIRRVVHIAPHAGRRWDDTIDSRPFPIGCPVTVHMIGTKWILDTPETPDMRPCPRR